MDFLPVIQSFLGTFWYVIPFFIFAAILNSAWFKGALGEFMVNMNTRLFLNTDWYRLLNNVTLPTEDGGSTQIDHILVSNFGIFVVETKNMKGWIFGDSHKKTWTQKIYRHSTRFQNPLHQNYKHLKTLEATLGVDEAALFSVVVFVGDCTFKTPMPDNVTYGSGYIDYVKSKTDFVFSDEDIEKIVEQIKTGRLTRSLKTHRQHVNHVRQIVDDKKRQPSCPKCGGEMVRREVKKGENLGKPFLGCARFPKCRGILNLT